MSGTPIERYKLVQVVLIALFFALLVSACSDEGEGGSVISSLGESGEVTLPEGGEATLPEVTAPPAAEDPPATEAEPASETADEGTSEDDNTVALVVILGLIVLVAILLGVTVGRSRRRDEPSG